MINRFGEGNHIVLFKDFLPEKAREAGFFSAAVYKAFGNAVSQANEWGEQTGVRVVNIETVVLPNIYRDAEEGSTDAQIRTSGDMSSRWYQFVRVWYQGE